MGYLYNFHSRHHPAIWYNREESYSEQQGYYQAALFDALNMLLRLRIITLLENTDKRPKETS